MGAGISIETDIEMFYHFISTVDAVAKGDMQMLQDNLVSLRFLRTRLSRSALMQLRRKEIVEMTDVVDTEVRDSNMLHIHRRSVEFERGLESGMLELGDTLLHIAARRGDHEMVLYLLKAGSDRGILDANARGFVPSEVTGSKDIQRDLDDLGMVFEVCGPRFELQNLAWQMLKTVRDVWSCWMVNSFHEAGCIVRALTQVKRSDSTLFAKLSNLVVRESQKIGRKVHKRGLQIARTLLRDENYSGENHDPATAAETFSRETPKQEIWELAKDIFKYVFYKNDYWDNPEDFRVIMYCIFVKHAMGVWLQLAAEELGADADERKKLEELEKRRAVEAKKRLFKMLELEKQGVERDENWDKEEEKEEDVVGKYIKDHTSEWKAMYEKEGRVPREMKDFFREHKLSKNKARRVLGISRKENAKLAKEKELAAQQRKAKILGYDAVEQQCWEHRLVPPGGRYDTVAASLLTLKDYSGMDLKPHFVERNLGNDPKGRVEGENHQVIVETE
jgi:hypothetical protein